MKPLLGSKLLVFIAHPDDESYTCAGTLYKNNRQGGKTVLVCATFGENGTAFIVKPVTKAGVRKTRKRELMRSAGFLNISKTILLGLPDGKLTGRQREIINKGAKIVRRYKPDFILSFGPDGFSGHKDHIAVGKAAQVIARRLGVPFVTFSLPPTFRRTSASYLKSRRKSLNYKSVRYSRPNLKIKIDPAVERKSLRIYASQKGVGKNPFAGLKCECFTAEKRK